MLYIKFRRNSKAYYAEFLTLFEHLQKVRSIGMEAIDKSYFNLDWEHVSADEFEALTDINYPKYKRIEEYFPPAVQENLLQYSNSVTVKNEYLLEILNYLEVGFEVDLNEMEQLNETTWQVHFSTGNYPFGGIDRFIIVLKAFGLMPFEYFDGFKTVSLD